MNPNSARALKITIRGKTRYDYAEELLRDWGLWMAKAVDGLSSPSMSTIGKLIELGAGASPDGTFRPISPNYFPNGETRRAHEAHKLILELPRDMQNALEARYVYEYGIFEVKQKYGYSKFEFYSKINQSLAYITGARGKKIY